MSVFIGSNLNPTAQAATVTLPGAVYAEKDGTFTNFEGRTQRIHRAFEPFGQAMEEGEILGRLATAFDLGWGPRRAELVFADMVASEKEFKPLTWDGLQESGALLASARKSKNGESGAPSGGGS